MAFARLAWVIFVFTALPEPVSSYIETLGVVAEASLTLWLLTIGVKRREVARRSDSGQRP